MYSKKFSLRKITTMLIVAMAVTMFYSCDDDSDAEGKARVKVSMTDAPGDYKNVFIDVQDVKVKSNISADEEGWVSLSGVEPRIYDLLELTGGVTQLLANSELETGTLGQIRVILGPDNTLVLNDGSEVPLSTPSAQQSGLKLQVNQELQAGMEYEYLLDFDVDQSIVRSGNSGGYILKPVIRLVNLESTGTIEGEVQPSLSQSVVKAANANHNITAYAATDGKFSLNGVPPGTYQVTVTPAIASGLEVKVINNVQVSSGASVDLDVIFLNEL
ncbi:DUF4382 domain-containing protein [Gillisia limnaea]|nr:DUF4382 domain-containing protein [Gillisia limnaea]